jgi:flagellar P-ring protein precursor FlgI
VASIGNAKSLRGGTLIATPLKGADGQIYALAQGNLIVGGAGASAGGSKVQINHLSAGRIPEGATVERSVPTPLNQGDTSSWTCNANDFATARAVARPSTAPRAKARPRRWTAAWCACACRPSPDARVAFLADIENLPLELAKPRRAHRAQRAHRLGGAERRRHAGRLRGGARQPVGDHQLHAGVSQPNAAVAGQTVVTEKTDIAITQQGGALISCPPAPSWPTW